MQENMTVSFENCVVEQMMLDRTCWDSCFANGWAGAGLLSYLRTVVRLSLGIDSIGSRSLLGQSVTLSVSVEH
jgi:hypothetical protein